MKDREPIKKDQPDEQPSFNKGQHLLRSCALQPNHLKSKKVKELLSKEELDKWFALEYPTDTLHLGS